MQGKELSSLPLETFRGQQGVYQENVAFEAQLWDSIQD